MGKVASLKFVGSVITLSEQVQIQDTDTIEYIRNLNLDLSETEYEGIPKYLGINYDLWTSYYIGIEWLKKGDKAIAVLPKVPNIDFNKMFVEVLSFAPASDYFNKFYGIRINEPLILYPQANAILTPLIITHYLYVMKKLIKHGLIKDYVINEENLKGKVKGKISISRHISHNIIPHRKEYTMCRYQELTKDIPINRLLKRALKFSIRALSFLPSKDLFKVQAELRKCVSKFEGVSDNVELYSVRNLKYNKLFMYYKEAVPLAKLILKRYDNSIDNISETSKTPPFWIDMSRLYEVYVYSKFFEKYGEEIKFQVPGHYNTAADFVIPSQNLIMDTKYKPRYGNGNRGMIDDIREISGYARDTLITKGMDKNKEPDCLIIYPFTHDDNAPAIGDTLKFDPSQELIKDSTSIKGFRGFYKIAVELPLKK